MNELAVCLLVAMGVSMMAVIIVIQIEPISAIVKTEDPDQGGEIKAPSTGVTPNLGLPATASEEKSKPQIAKKVIPFPELKLATPVTPNSELQQSQPVQVIAPHKVKVTFDSVTVHNSHEGALSGDGEYDLSAYVHGKLVSLTDMSRKTGASGLWDVSSGETVRFPPGSEITVDIEKHLPLSILTVGSEIDECGRTSFPTNLQPQIVTLLTDNWVGQGVIKAVNTLNPLGGIQDQVDKAINYIGCKFNKNDDIGDIVKAYDAVGYGAGPHFDKSDKGDFSLAYTISVTAPPTQTPQSTKEESSKPVIVNKLPFGLKLVTPTIPSSGPAPSDTTPYKVKVTFDSVTVHNSHEGALSGDGEYDLSAYVHGKLVSLTDMSRKTGASGLWDVSSGETVRFPPGSEITVDIEKHLPLSILTVGSEIDECGRTSFPTNLQPQIVTLLTDNWVGQGVIKAVNTLNPLGGIQDQVDKAINYIGCKFNKNDDIGDIVKAYDAVGYGAGSHFDKSDKGDFSLAYTISVLPR